MSSRGIEPVVPPVRKARMPVMRSRPGASALHHQVGNPFDQARVVVDQPLGRLEELVVHVSSIVNAAAKSTSASAKFLAPLLMILVDSCLRLLPIFFEHPSVHLRPRTIRGRGKNADVDPLTRPGLRACPSTRDAPAPERCPSRGGTGPSSRPNPPGREGQGRAGQGPCRPPPSRTPRAGHR